MQIIEKEIDWLYEKVPDFKTFLESNDYILNNGGYVAGGFLRKAIKHGSAEYVLDEMAELRMTGDVDWFFFSQYGCKSAYNHLTEINKMPAYTEPNSVTMFAFEGMVPHYKKGAKHYFDRVKYQFIYKSFGKPSTVLNRFDIANCKIATDGKKVWMVEDWEELEEHKKIRVDNFAGDFLISRLRKYLKDGFSILEEQREELLKKMLESVSKYEAAIKYLINNSNVVTVDTILLFYQKLGQTYEKVSPNDYQDGTLGKQTDFALHMFNKMKKEQPNA